MEPPVAGQAYAVAICLPALVPDLFAPFAGLALTRRRPCTGSRNWRRWRTPVDLGLLLSQLPRDIILLVVVLLGFSATIFLDLYAATWTCFEQLLLWLGIAGPCDWSSYAVCGVNPCGGGRPSSCPWCWSCCCSSRGAERSDPLLVSVGAFLAIRGFRWPCRQPEPPDSSAWPVRSTNAARGSFLAASAARHCGLGLSTLGSARPLPCDGRLHSWGLRPLPSSRARVRHGRKPLGSCFPGLCSVTCSSFLGSRATASYWWFPSLSGCWRGPNGEPCSWGHSCCAYRRHRRFPRRSCPARSSGRSSWEYNALLCVFALWLLWCSEAREERVLARRSASQAKLSANRSMVARASLSWTTSPASRARATFQYDEPGTTMSLNHEPHEECAKVKLCPARRLPPGGPPILREKKLRLAARHVVARDRAAPPFRGVAEPK